MPALRAKSLAMTAFLRGVLEAEHSSVLALITPADAAGHGCQLSMRVRAGRDAGRRLFEALGRRGVVADWREPDILRVAAVPLYNSWTDLARFLVILGDVLREAT
jgi:kynureninase